MGGGAGALLPISVFWRELSPAIRERVREPGREGWSCVLGVAGAGLAGCPAMGGVMAEVKVVEGVRERSDVAGVAAVNPEIGSARRVNAPAMLKGFAVIAVQAKLDEIVTCIMTNITKGHLPSAKLLFDLASKMVNDEEIPEAEMKSIAEFLWKAAEHMGLEIGD